MDRRVFLCWSLTPCKAAGRLELGTRKGVDRTLLAGRRIAGRPKPRWKSLFHQMGAETCALFMHIEKISPSLPSDIPVRRINL